MLEEKRLEMIRMRTCRLFCMRVLHNIYCLFRKKLRIFRTVYRANGKSVNKRGIVVKEPYKSEYYVI